MNEDDKKFAALFEGPLPTSGKNALDKNDVSNNLRVLGLYLVGEAGSHLLPIMTKVDWVKMFGPVWGQIVIIGTGLLLGGILDLCRRWAKDYTPPLQDGSGNSEPPKPDNSYRSV